MLRPIARKDDCTRTPTIAKDDYYDANSTIYHIASPTSPASPHRDAEPELMGRQRSHASTEDAARQLIRGPSWHVDRV